MKFLSLFLLIGCLHAAALTNAQLISLSYRNAPIEKIFKEITRQTAINFIYTRETIENALPVSVELKGAAVDEALKECFAGQPLTFVREGNYVSVKYTPVVKLISPVAIAFADISGRVTAENGEGLAGVTIAVRNSDQVFTTDNQGVFVLKGVDPEATLLFTSVGFESVSETLRGRTRIDIRMRISVSKLDETVVIGYGTTTRRFNTGSVGRITAAEISRQPVSNVLATMAGRMPGVIITQTGGLPGANVSVLIRGRNSIQNGNSPYFVIDGVPFVTDADRFTQRSGINSNSPFNTINPEDIESIEVLKDADATAIYGSKGANGVILITTKKGTNGKTLLDLSVKEGWGKALQRTNFMNTAQYLAMRREALKNDGVAPTIVGDKDLLVWDSSKYTDWQKFAIGGQARMTNYQLNLTGGSAGTKFNLSVGYGKEKTVFPGDFGDKRYSITFGINHLSVNKKLALSLSTSYNNTDNGLIPSDITNLASLPPNFPALYDSLGRLNWTAYGYSFSNPLSPTSQNYDVVNTRYTINGVITYKLLPWISLKVAGGISRFSTDEKILGKIAAQDPTTNPMGSSSFGNSISQSWILEPQLELSTKFAKKGVFKAVLGTSFQETTAKSTLLEGSLYTSDALLQTIAAAGAVTATNAASIYRYNAAFARLNYTYNARYLINLTGRRDASSRFGPGNQFANFGAAGLGWIFSETGFLRNNFEALSFGKMRASYGITGSDQIGNYQYLDTWSPTANLYQGMTGLRPTKLFNRDYSWEQIRKTELGVELGFFRDRLTVNVDWYKSLSDNQIILYSEPSQTGFTNIILNFPGKVENNGWEFEVRSTNIRKTKFSWTTTFNLTIPRNLLREFPGLATSSYGTSYIIGKPLNSKIGYKYRGINDTSGVYEFVDINKDNLLNDADRVWLGTRDRKWFGGFGNNLAWGGLELDIFFEFNKQLGNEAVLSTGNAAGLFYVNQPVQAGDRWQTQGDNTKYQKYTATFATKAYRANSNAILSDAILTDASFARLKNFSFSYTLNNLQLRKIGLEKAKLYVQAQNILTITDYKGADPEAQSLVALPPLRMIVLGLQLTF